MTPWGGGGSIFSQSLVFLVFLEFSADSTVILQIRCQNHWTVGSFGNQICKIIGLSALLGIRYAKSLDCRLFLASDVQIHWTVGSFGIKNAYSTSKIKDFQLKVPTVQTKSMIFGQKCLQHKQNQ